MSVSFPNTLETTKRKIQKKSWVHYSVAQMRICQAPFHMQGYSIGKLDSRQSISISLRAWMSNDLGDVIDFGEYSGHLIA